MLPKPLVVGEVGPAGKGLITAVDDLSAVDIGCGSVPARVAVKRTADRLRAKWRVCGEHRRVRFTATIAKPECRVLRGRIKAKGLKVRTFTAIRSVCGDQVLDEAGGEECEVSVAGGDAACPGRCRTAVHSSSCTCTPSVSTSTIPIRATSPITTSTTSTSTTTLAPMPCTCEAFGFPEGGELHCSGACTGCDFNGCYWCNNGVLEPGEECDGIDLNGHTCRDADLGAYAGDTPICTSVSGFCRVDYTPCRWCGDGDVNHASEQCDDGNAVSGDGCSATCQLECGDNITAPTEECDDGNLLAGDGCDAFCSLENPYAGGTTGDTVTTGGVPGPSTAIDQCGAVVSVSSAPNGATVTCRTGTACDKDLANAGCTFEYYVCFSRTAQTCGAGALQQVSLLTPTAAEGTALSATDQAAFLVLAQNVLGRDGGTVTTSGATASVSPPSTRADQCAEARLTVPTSQSRTLKFAAVRASFCTSGSRAGQFCSTNAECLGAPCSYGSTDQDLIAFQCTP